MLLDTYWSACSASARSLVALPKRQPPPVQYAAGGSEDKAPRPKQEEMRPAHRPPGHHAAWSADLGHGQWDAVARPASLKSGVSTDPDDERGVMS